MSAEVDAVVVGAGIIGLTTAIRLCEAGATTLVITADDPTSTTSALATAMVGPTFGFSGPRASAWEQSTIHTFLQEPEAPGVHVCRGRFLSQPAGFVPPGADALAGFELCGSHDLPAGYNTGFWAEVERCSAIEPRLRDARVLEHRIGKRPDRPDIRLEVEQRRDTRVVHNYGHGGLGVTLS